MKTRNALVALGGGPSPVINASLFGVVDGCARTMESGGTLFAALHGVEGILTERFADLYAEDPAELSKLRHTPASGAIGTCRYKLQPDAQEDFSRIVDVLHAHDIGTFFYIGGNDSMDTAHKVEQLARSQGYDLTVMGIPKTIDNDLGDEARTLIDHTPGYGSVARYWAMLMQDVEEENRGMCVSEPVSVVQAMGRKSGFITAAARLADPERQTPMLLLFAESHTPMERVFDAVDDRLRRFGRCKIVVNEGFETGEDIGARVDGFGHTEYGASEISVAQQLVNALNRRGMPARGTATGQLPGVLQRATSVCRSPIDVEEAVQVARHAVEQAFLGVSGQMATILRDESAPAYRAYFDTVPLDVIANSERFLPPTWIAPDGMDVTDDFVAYARPLIGDAMSAIPLVNGLQDFARLRLQAVEARCPTYVPMNFRTS